MVDIWLINHPKNPGPHCAGWATRLPSQAPVMFSHNEAKLGNPVRIINQSFINDVFHMFETPRESL